MFRRPTIRYGAMPVPETPYQRAGQVWDERIGSARVQAKNWRLAFFGTLILSGGLTVGLVWQSARGRSSRTAVQDDTDPRARVTQANGEARVQTTRAGYINAIQVYPFSDGALLTSPNIATARWCLGGVQHHREK